MVVIVWVLGRQAKGAKVQERGVERIVREKSRKEDMIDLTYKDKCK